CRVAPPVAQAGHRGLVALQRVRLAPRTFTAMPLLRPETLHLLVLAGLAARHQPNEPSDLFASLPRTWQWELVLRVWFARTWRQLFTGQPDPRAFMVTGAAAFGLVADRRLSPLTPFTVTAGHLDGPVAEKTFPLPRWAQRVPGLARLTSTLFDVTGVFAPTDADHPYGWCQDDNAPVDLADYARQVTMGPLAYLEGYFPLRLELDIGCAHAGARDGDLAAIVHEDAAAAKPTVHVMGDSDTFVTRLLRAGRMLPDDAIAMANYTHIDVVSAGSRDGDSVAGHLVDHLAKRATASTTGGSR
ncbi:MAG: hypothetical protein ACRD0G_13990, partial [Acidimicrobiales bacterium]